MTCIAAWLEDGDVWMGGDSAGCNGWDLTIRLDPKVFKVGEFLIGCTSSYRMMQLLRYQLQVPEHPSGMDDFEYMVKHFVESVREVFDRFKYGKRDTEKGDQGGCFLVGYRGNLFYIDADFQVGIPDSRFYAIGCGADYAIGALSALEDDAVDDAALNTPEKRLSYALAVAERWPVGVRGPFVIEKV